MDDLTHNITFTIFTINGNYHHGEKQHATFTLAGDGSMDHLFEVFKMAIVAAGYSLEAAQKLSEFEI